MHAGGAAHPLEVLVHQNPQDLALGLLGHVGDFIEVEGASMGLLEGADLARAPVPALRPEELFLHGFRRDGRGVQDHEGAARPQRRLVNGAHHQFLAGARRARDHDARIGGRHALDHLPQLVHDGGSTDDPVGGARPRAQFANFPLQAGGLERPLRHQHETIGLEGFFDEIISPKADRLNRRLNIAVA